MERKPTLLVAGNGLAIDLCRHHNLEARWNPSSPLSWVLPAVENSLESLIECFPRFKTKIDKQREVPCGLTDFDLFETILSQVPAGQEGNFEELMVQPEMRHFLALAYSYFQLMLDTLSHDAWVWSRYLVDVIDDVKAVISFNYDLIIETALEAGGFQGVVTKPHGSVDFAPISSAIVMTASYPMQNFIELNNMPIQRLDRSDLVQPRVEADIVLPTESSPYLGYQWVAPQYAHLRQVVSPHIERCIVAGISYWLCDQREIDFIFDSLTLGTEIVIANPYPPGKLVDRAASVGPVTLWTNGPESYT